MKKLTELDLQNALDECELIQFKSHGAWLAGMIKRLNIALGNTTEKKKETKRTVIKISNSTEPEVPCKS
jgi:ribosomal protein L3